MPITSLIRDHALLIYLSLLDMFRLKKKGQEILSTRRNDDDGDDDDGALDEFELMVANSIQKPDESKTTPIEMKGSDKDEKNEKPELLLSENATEEVSEISTVSDTKEDLRDESPKKVWKRSKDPLPEQCANVKVKSRKTLKQELIHNKVRLAHNFITAMYNHWLKFTTAF